jgi:hypothetical protein
MSFYQGLGKNGNSRQRLGSRGGATSKKQAKINSCLSDSLGVKRFHFKDFDCFSNTQFLTFDTCHVGRNSMALTQAIMTLILILLVARLSTRSSSINHLFNLISNSQYMINDGLNTETIASDFHQS